MFCSACGNPLDAQGNCERCRRAAALETPVGADPLAAVAEPTPHSHASALLQSLALICTALVLFLNYSSARHWAGDFTAEASGYMFGGIFVSFLLGMLGMFIASKIRQKKIAPDSKMAGVALIAVAISLLSFAREAANSRAPTQAEINLEVGHLMKQAAGVEPLSNDRGWWQGPTRDMFRDIMERNKDYIAEVKGLDHSATKDLYSPASYSDKAKMEKTVAQLQAMEAVEQKYASLDPVVQKMKDHIQAAHATAEQKEEFLDGMNSRLDQELTPRKEALGVEEVWLKKTMELYRFTIAHFSEYSVRGGKLYFRNDSTREAFIAQQHEAVTSYKEFLNAKKSFDNSRQSRLDRVGVSTSDFSPEQLGKAK